MTSYSERRIRLAAVLMAIIMLFGTITVTAVPVNAASKGKLVKSVKIYTRSGKTWKSYGTLKYTYNSKKDPIKIVSKYPGYSAYTEQYTYTYQAGKKTVMKTGGEYPVEVTYDSMGRRILEKGQFYTNKITYDTKNKNLIKTIVNEADGTVPTTTTFQYKYYKNKLPLAFKSAGDMSNSSAFNKKGFATNFRSYNVAEGNQLCKYTYDKKGIVKSVIVSEIYGKKSYDRKYVFSYYSKKIPIARYRSMINVILTGSGPACGTYWY